MVMDHRQIDRVPQQRIAPTRSPRRGCVSYQLTRCQALLTTMLLCQVGCQSVVDPGRSMNAGRPPQAAVPMMPSTAPFQTQTPPVATTDQSGVVRQPAAAVIQLPQAKAGESKYHTVVAGDTWTALARKYQLTVSELTDANGIDPATTLQPGQLVYIPEK